MNKTVRNIIKEHSNSKCYYCGLSLEKRWHIDHFFPQNRKHYLKSEKMMKPIYKNGDAPNNLTDIDDYRNLVPSCIRCNNWKHSSLVSQFKKQIVNVMNGLNNHSQFKIAVDYNMIYITNEIVQFYFETDEMIEKHKIRIS